MSEPARLALPALDPSTVEVRSGSGYPEPHRAAVAARSWRPLGRALGLVNFGVNLVRLPPGTASSQRHWHTHEDEFVMILEGTAVLVTDRGEQTLGPGMVAGFRAGVPDGHHLLNRTDADVVLLAVGDRRDEDACDYPDIDMHVSVVDGRDVYTHIDGTPYD